MADQAITILMGVYNGEAVLTPQLRSLDSQDLPAWRLICSDDGSEDNTIALIEQFARTIPQDVRLTAGPGRGFSANFMSLIRQIDPACGAVAFADQDDVWLEDKLSRACAMLATVDPSRPALYCARRWIWDAETDRRIATPPSRRAPSFRNALIENVAPGNTIVLNAAAADLARLAAARTGDVFAHDWWLYLLISGVGGTILVDDGPPCILYRQHDGNAIGQGQAAQAQILRKLKVLQGAFRERLGGNLAAMLAIEDMLTPENAGIARAFETARQAHLPARIAGLRSVAPYRQTAWGNLGFWGAAFLGRV